MTLGDSIRKGVGMVHGTGEAIRGNINAAVDNASGDKASAVKNQEIAQKGVDEWDRGYRGHALGTQPGTGVGHNVAPADAHNTSTGWGAQPGTGVGRNAAPSASYSTSANAGPTGHVPSTGMGPGTAGYDPSTAGHHQSNLANKLDPRVDSDMDHRANPSSHVGIQGQGAGGYGGVGSTNAGPHASNVGNKLDPRIDSDADHRANPGSNVGGRGY